MNITKKPVSPLNRFVQYIWLYESPVNSAKINIQRFIVQGCPIMLFHYKQPLTCKTGENNWAAHPQQCLIGQVKSYGEIIETGDEGMIAVVFYPDGLYPLLKIPVDRLTGLIVDLPDLFGKEINRLYEKICRSNTGQIKISLVEQFLLNRIMLNTLHDNNNIRRAISMMQGNYNLNITDLASEVNMSRRNFERKFLENVGLSPVFYNRIARFQKAVQLMNKRQMMSLPQKVSFTEIAFSAGYFDQSHFIRDFRIFYGQTPGEFNQLQNFG